LNLLASLEPSAAFDEPEFRGDVRIDKGLEYFGDRLANKHSSVCNRHLFELEIVHSDSDFGCILRPKFDEQKTRRIRRVKYWEMIADSLSKAGWRWGCVAAVYSRGRTIFVADAHRDNGKRFVGRSDEKLTAFLELESATRVCGDFS